MDTNQRSAYERAAASDGVDPRCIPLRLPDADLRVGDAIRYPDYAPAEHATWKALYARQTELLHERACDAFLEGLDAMRFAHDRIPALSAVSRTLEQATGWKVARAPGLLHEEDFFRLLAAGIFPATDTIRGWDEMDYTPAPDLFHDVFAHTPMIVEPTFAEFYRRIGGAALRAKGEDRRRVERFYWFTVEFGLLRTGAGLRVYGNGILSSAREIVHALTPAVEKLPFDPEAIASCDYDVSHVQPRLFVIESFDQLVDGFAAWASSRGLADP